MLTTTDLEQIKAFTHRQTRPWLIAFGVAVALVVILLFTLFHRSRPFATSEGRIEALDSVLHYQQERIEDLQYLQAEQDSVIAGLKSQLKGNKVIETKIIHQYEQIPADVRSYDRERLRREVSDY